MILHGYLENGSKLENRDVQYNKPEPIYLTLNQIYVTQLARKGKLVTCCHSDISKTGVKDISKTEAIL